MPEIKFINLIYAIRTLRVVYSKIIWDIIYGYKCKPRCAKQRETYCSNIYDLVEILYRNNSNAVAEIGIAMCDVSRKHRPVKGCLHSNLVFLSLLLSTMRVLRDISFIISFSSEIW